MMVMNLVRDLRDSTAERSSLFRRISSSAMNFAVSMMAKPMITRPAPSSTPVTFPCTTASTTSTAAARSKRRASSIRKIVAMTK